MFAFFSELWNICDAEIPYLEKFLFLSLVQNALTIYKTKTEKKIANQDLVDFCKTFLYKIIYTYLQKLPAKPQ